MWTGQESNDYKRKGERKKEGRKIGREGGRKGGQGVPVAKGN